MLITAIALVAGGLVVGFAAATAPPPSSIPTAASPAAASGTSGGTSPGTSTGDGEAAVPLTVPATTAPNGLTDGRTLGRSGAPVTLVVWSDFQCPSCGAFARQVQPRLLNDFVIPGILKVVYRDYAFIGQESIDAAVAARCASDQGQFWPYHDYLFWNQKGENSGAFGRATLEAIGARVGLQMPSFQACLGSAAQIDAVQADSTAAKAAGVQYTPSLQIGPTLMPGAPLTDAQYDVLRKVIERALAEASATPPSPSPANP